MRFCTTQQTKVLLTLCTVLGYLLLSCRGFRESEEQRLRRRNRVREPIASTRSGPAFFISTPKYHQREKYPWEERYIGAYPRITKEFFRCRGNPTHPIRTLPQDKGQPLKVADCEGGDKHGLPILNGEEAVYPVLLELLNYVQEKTAKRVVVTSGHRCPVHNSYIDGSVQNQTSKHQIGAEVDFYVEEMENQPEAIIGLVKEYYKEHPSLFDKKGYVDFQRSRTKEGRVLNSWYNKEIVVKVSQASEGRNLDNQHPYPYITLQVRHDRATGQPVSYSWKQANQGYRRG